MSQVSVSDLLTMFEGYLGRYNGGTVRGKQKKWLASTKLLVRLLSKIDGHEIIDFDLVKDDEARAKYRYTRISTGEIIAEIPL